MRSQAQIQADHRYFVLNAAAIRQDTEHRMRQRRSDWAREFEEYGLFRITPAFRAVLDELVMAYGPKVLSEKIGISRASLWRWQTKNYYVHRQHAVNVIQLAIEHRKESR